MLFDILLTFPNNGSCFHITHSYCFFHVVHLVYDAPNKIAVPNLLFFIFTIHFYVHDGDVFPVRFLRFRYLSVCHHPLPVPGSSHKVLSWSYWPLPPSLCRDPAPSIPDMLCICHIQVLLLPLLALRFLSHGSSRYCAVSVPVLPQMPSYPDSACFLL